MITSNSSITGSFVPNFRLDNLQPNDILIYSLPHDAFVNSSAHALSLNLDGGSIQNYVIAKNHLSASASGGEYGEFLTIDNAGNLAWAALTNTDPQFIELGSLLDVDVLGKTDGAILKYDGISKWVIGTHEMASLGDVTVTSVADKDALLYSTTNSKWENRAITLADIDAINLADVAIGDVLQWTGTEWAPATPDDIGGDIAFNNLSDVDTTGLLVGDVIQWDGSAWVPVPLASIGMSVDDLSDTTITAPQYKNVLLWNGSEWINEHIDYADILNAPDLSGYAVADNLSTVATTGSYLDLTNKPGIFNGVYSSLAGIPATFAPSTHTHTIANITDIGTLNVPVNLDDLADVDAVGPTNGDLLSWNAGTNNWVPIAAPSPAISSLSDVNIGVPVAGDFLRHDGIDWRDSTISTSDVVGLGAEILSYNNQFAFIDLTDAGTPAVGHMKWSGSAVTYNSTIPVADITGLHSVATSGNYSQLHGIPSTFAPSVHTHDIADAGDINYITALADKQFLVYNNGTTYWENRIISLTDVNIPSGTAGQSIVWNTGTSTWVPGTLTIDNLSDVTVTTPANTQFLKYSGGGWTNSYISYSDITGFAPAPPSHSHAAGDITGLNAVIVAANGLLNFADLSDAGTPVDGFMKFDTGGVTYQTSITTGDITGLSTVATTGLYSSLSGIPSTFEPSVHLHTLLGLSDTAGTAVANGFLRWNAGGTQVTYVTTIAASSITGLATVATSGLYADISGTPALAPVALSGDYADLTNVVVTWDDITSKPLTFAPATHIHNISDIVGLQVDLDSKLESSVTTLPSLSLPYSQITGAPTIPSNGDFSFMALSDTANITQPERSGKFLRWNPQGTRITYQKYIPVANITGVSQVGKTGDYDDLLNKPIITDTNDYNDLLNTPNLNIYATTASLATVALSGNYADLRFKPTLFNGAYSSLTGKPTAFPPSTHTHVASDITDLNLTTSMKDLTDVGIVNVATLNEGDILYWDKALGKWKPRANASVTNYADMDSESVPDGFLRWNSQGTKIIYQKNISVANVSGLSSVGINGYLNNLIDVVIDGTLSAGQALIYDGAKWTNDAVDVSGGSTNDSVASLTDTTISGLADGDMLVYDLTTTSWVNAPQPEVSTPSRIQNALNTSFVDVTVGNTIAVTAANGITLTSASGDIILEGQKWPNSDGTNGQVLKTDGLGNLSWFTSPAGVTTFIGLSDTPGTYTGQGNKLVSVNAVGNALEFIDVPAATVTHLEHIGNVNDDELGVGTDVGKVLKWSGTEWIGEKVAYSELTNLPSNFPPAAHNHDGVYAQKDDIDNLVTLSGVAADATTMGAFSGTTIPDGSDIKECLQALETKFESIGVTSRVTNITVTVGTGGDYATINAALSYLSGLYPLYVKSGFTATVKLLSGFTMAEQVIVLAIDLGWITITDSDSSHSLTRSALTTLIGGVYPAFAALAGGKLPKINAEFVMDTSGTAANRCGIYVSGAGSSATITPSNGVRHASGCSIYATNGAVVSAPSCLASYSGVGIWARDGATVYAENAYVNDCSIYGIAALGGATISAAYAYAPYCGIGVISDRSSRIDFSNGNAKECISHGVYAQNLGQITAQYAECRKVTGSNTASDIVVVTGGIISAHGAVGGTTPALKNTPIAEGIIFG